MIAHWETVNVQFHKKGNHKYTDKDMNQETRVKSQRDELKR